MIASPQKLPTKFLMVSNGFFSMGICVVLFIGGNQQNIFRRYSDEGSMDSLRRSYDQSFQTGSDGCRHDIPPP